MADARRWWLLIHQIPPRPPYLRTKIARRLARLGAVAVKNSVYALPATDPTLEDLQWVRREVVAGLLGELAARVSGSRGAAGGTLELADYHRRTWVTRQNIHVDRIACAWLIRRFIDPEARFRFVPGKTYEPRPGELRFDMFDAEFTHEGDRCSFEVLLERFGLRDPGLRAIAEIVHDIDLKDGKFGRADAEGVARVLSALALSAKDDDERVARGSSLFDDLHKLYARD